MIRSFANVDDMLSDQLSNRIGNLKVYSSQGDSPALRMQIANAFSSVDIQPPGMPPSAILMVRKINDPMPGVLLPELSGKKVKFATGSSKSSWQIALRSQLGDFYHAANRPTNGMLTGEQDAVFFADQAELLACFCRDLLKEAVSGKWWWRRYFGQSLQTIVPGVMIYNVLVEVPRLVPSVISLLAEWHCAIKLVKMIDAFAVQQITQTVLHEFGLAGLDEKLREGIFFSDSLNTIEEDQSEIPESAGSFANQSNSIDTPYSRNNFGTLSCAPPPWLNLFNGECWEEGLSKEQLGLIGIARLLQSSPMTLREENFQRQVVHWWSATGQRELQQQDLDFQANKQKRTEVSRSGDKSNNDKFSTNSQDCSKITFIEPVSENEEDQREVEFSAESSNTIEDITHQNLNEKALKLSGQSDASLPNNNVDIYNAEDNFQRSEPATFEESTKPRNQGDNVIPIVAKADSPEQAYSFDQEEMPGPHIDSELEDNLVAEAEFDDVDFNFSDTYFETQLGGILYLINLLNQLDLPACMGESWKFDQQLSRWTLVDIIARALLAKNFKEIDKDPIWRMLAKLDQRRNKKDIGKGFQAQSDYSMPLDWYHYFIGKALSQVQQLYWASHNRRLRIWADYGVIIELKVTDIELNESLVLKELHKYSPDINPQWLHRGLYRQAPMANQSQLFRSGINQDIGHWLALVLPPIRAYLQDILSVSSTTTQALLTNLFQCEGRIYVSSSYIDLVASVNSTKLSLRCCGLDQDPGWLPEYGRVVLFHYTQA